MTRHAYRPPTQGKVNTQTRKRTQNHDLFAMVTSQGMSQHEHKPIKESQKGLTKTIKTHHINTDNKKEKEAGVPGKASG